MPDADDFFVEKVEKSFKKAKEHINGLESEAKANREHIIHQNSQINAILSQITGIIEENRSLRLRIRELERGSTGSEGVYSFIHSFTKHSLGMHKTPELGEIGQISDGTEEMAESEAISGPEEEAVEEPMDEPEPLDSVPEGDEDTHSEDGQEGISPSGDEETLADTVEAIDDEEQPNPVEVEDEEEAVPVEESGEEEPKGILNLDVNKSLFEAIKGLSSSGNLKTPVEEVPEETEATQDPFETLSVGKKEFTRKFGTLTRQEIMTFLAVYQLEEDYGKVTYSDVAKKLKLTEGCIRTYVSGLMRKGIPVVKNKMNNKLVLLSVSPEFKELGLKKDIMEIYEKSDPRSRLDWM